ncbi:hypothetical protein SAMN05443247_06038 [Bradyrhizobium erythrophlei]|jgi:uncharacterized coiled-coil protein SlyX|nr:hypothetical protein SAMN05443247_06038 [Bradyrhizobium erythrophlei]
MIDLSYSHQRDQEDRAAVWARRQRMIVPLVAASILLGGGLSIVWGFGGVLTPSPSAVSAPAREQVSSELLETTKGLEVTQQQAVDQLQVVQDQLVAQQTETKKLAEQIATLTEKLDALQQSVANIPAPSVAAPLPTPKAPPSKK